MQEIDVLIDNNPDLSLELVTLDIRNQKAHRELQSFNDNRIFLFVHPFTLERKYKLSQLDELTDMRKEDPDKFINEITNIIQNIRRIESSIRLKKYKSEDELAGWNENLERARIRHEVIKTILKS